MTIARFAMSLQERASVIAANRHSDAKLYAILADCMDLAVLCLDPEKEKELRSLAGALPPLPGKKRHYIEKGSDIYQLVARYVFHGEKVSANINRYAITLRAAKERQIQGNDLAEWLARNGGINALYLSRPLVRTTVRTKCLRLTTQIEVPKDKEFTITLRRTPENAFEVLS